MAQARRKTKPKDAVLPSPEGRTSRPAWQGSLRLSLVTCKVGLYRATSATADISFNLINPKTNNMNSLPHPAYRNLDSGKVVHAKRICCGPSSLLATQFIMIG